jgi:hypothetical protein
MTDDDRILGSGIVAWSYLSMGQPDSGEEFSREERNRRCFETS